MIHSRASQSGRVEHELSPQPKSKNRSSHVEVVLQRILARNRQHQTRNRLSHMHAEDELQTEFRLPQMTPILTTPPRRIRA